MGDAGDEQLAQPHHRTESTMISTRFAKYTLPLAAAGLLAAGCSSGGSSTVAAGAGASSSSASNSLGATLSLSGGHLVDSTGKTVYLWTADTAGKSTCSGGCASVWPAVAGTTTPTAGTGVTASEITSITGDNGSSQLAYNNHPLYYFKSDGAVGDAKGQGNDGFGAKWWEVGGSGSAITSGPAAASSAPSSKSSSSSSGGGGYSY
jgi:predicted lipoprotein with Yx(FWY)xxD motif